jgi:hypothetical protein
MLSNTLILLFLIVVGGFFIAAGLPGLLTRDFVLRGRYGWRTHYTGMKALVIGGGFVIAGILFIVNGILNGLLNTGRFDFTAYQGLLLGAVASILIAWVLTFGVDGTAEHKRENAENN